MQLTCLGAARTVTGSKHLLEADGARILVDCGLFQGLKALRERNWQALPFRAQDIQSVVLTHAHLDHSGYLPRLVGQGFKGRIFCTPATANLTRIVLADAARIQEEDAERANRRGYTRHAPALPLFTVNEAGVADDVAATCSRILIGLRPSRRWHDSPSSSARNTWFAHAAARNSRRRQDLPVRGTADSAPSAA